MALTIAIVACGGRTPLGDLSGSSSLGGSGGSSGASGSGSGGISSGGSGSSSGAAHGSSSGAVSGSSSSGGVGGSSGVSSSSSGSSGGSASSSGGSLPPTDPQIVCGTAGSCIAPNVCCAGGGRGGQDICATQLLCVANMGDVYACTGQANCLSSQVCCVTTGTGGRPDVAACVTSCPTGGGGRGGRGGGGVRSFQVCQASSECPNGQTCGMTGAVALNVCQ